MAEITLKADTGRPTGTRPSKRLRPPAACPASSTAWTRPGPRRRRLAGRCARR